VGTVLSENHSPLYLIGAVASNVKPDASVVNAIAATQAADKLVEAMEKIDNFIKADKSGTRAYIYKMMTMERIVTQGDKNGHNTLFMTDVSGGASTGIIPMPAPAQPAK
jgi:hypothetical protein